MNILILISLTFILTLGCTTVQSSYQAEDYTNESYKREIDLSLMYIKIGDMSAAQDVLSLLARNRKNSMWYSTTALLLSTQGKNEAASNHYEKALTIDPNNLSALNNYATYWLKLNNPQKALYYLNKMDNMQKNSECFNLDACLEDGLLEYNQAQAYFQLGNKTFARERLEKAISKNKNISLAYLQMAKILDLDNNPNSLYWIDMYLESISSTGNSLSNNTVGFAIDTARKYKDINKLYVYQKLLK